MTKPTIAIPKGVVYVKTEAVVNRVHRYLRSDDERTRAAAESLWSFLLHKAKQEAVIIPEELHKHWNHLCTL